MAEKVVPNDNQNNGNILPKNTTLFNQVGGHDFTNGSIGILKENSGCILKPIINAIKGKKEIGFYENLSVRNNAVHTELKSFVPKYLGTVDLKVNDKVVTFIRLEDLTDEFLKPCVMDVKMGAQTWEPNCPKNKQIAEDAKYIESKRDFGFCIPGFIVHSPTSNRCLKFGKDFGRNLNKTTLPAALKTFLNADNGLNENLVLTFLKKLERIKRWFETQKNYAFYSSSILLVYDADGLTSKSTVDDSMVKAVMIDFAHVVEDTNVLDLNYLNGLKNLIEIFRSFLAT
nr:PREDICTED: inositol polyphosphate multikinase-like [Bemisia tabaci]XP_018901631.1 PREDICTED: inositol polyphosphate multikinase-like [Bemisia tabaci]XP_018901632.1 PREDICTED: inositol polyphosphate multikinase-like [Bemisia tabaci]